MWRMWSGVLHADDMQTYNIFIVLFFFVFQLYIFIYLSIYVFLCVLLLFAFQVFEMLAEDHHAPVLLHLLGSVSLFVSPSFTALLYGIRARSLRAAYKSYIRKRMTNNTLQHEIQQRLSPVDGGSPRPSSGAKSFR